MSEEVRDKVFREAIQDVNAWRKTMIHHMKEENPEINAAIIEIATKASVDAKGVALGAYLAYKMLEIAEKEGGVGIEGLLE